MTSNLSSPTKPGLADLPGTQLAQLLRTRQVKPSEVLDSVVARIDEVDPAVHAVVTRSIEQAARAAATMDQAVPADPPPLWGVPVTVKDLTPTAGVRTTRGLAVPARWGPDLDAVAVERLRAAGALVVAKTNTSEEGWKAETSNRLGPPTLNPWDLRRSAGGSSGGAAAAVACGFGPIATGTDGAGSIRIPAAFCGVIGFKPTFGAVPYWPSSPERLSHLGPLGRHVADVSAAFDVLAGPDPRDPDSDVQLLPPAGRPGLRIGVVRASADWPTDPEIEAVLRHVADRCSDLGLRVDEAPDLPSSYEPLEVTLSAFEAAPYAPGGLGDESAHIDPGRLAVIERGLRLSATELARAASQRLAVTIVLGHLWESWDLLLMPTTSVCSIAPESTGPLGAETTTDRLRWACFSYPWNLTGDPACTLPVIARSALPIGVQLAGPRRTDRQVLDVAAHLEATGIVGAARPPLLGEAESAPTCADDGRPRT